MTPSRNNAAGNATATAIVETIVGDRWVAAGVEPARWVPCTPSAPVTTRTHQQMLKTAQMRRRPRYALTPCPVQRCPTDLCRMTRLTFGNAAAANFRLAATPDLGYHRYGFTAVSTLSGRCSSAGRATDL